MKVRIQNDGENRYSTRITSVETGEELRYVTKADISIDASKGEPTVVLTMFHPVVDIIADAEIRNVCPCCGRAMETRE